MLSRRDLLAAALGTASAFIPKRSDAAMQGLAAAAAGRGRFFGAAVRLDQLNLEPDLRSSVLSECTHIVPETELKWAVIAPSQDELSFVKPDALANFAKANGKRMRGHTLIWHRSIPPWAEESLRTNRDWNIIARYFGSVVPRYDDVIEQWDVVNEPIDTGHRMDGLRESAFLDAFGPQYIDRALVQARSFAPRAQLLINEFGLEYNLPVERDRRYLLLKLLERLKHAAVPLDGLGLQAHLNLGKGHISETAISTFLTDVAAMGLTVVVTELDVKEADYTAPVDQRDRLVASEVGRYLDVVLDHPGVSGVATWGLTDRHSWLEVTQSDYARFNGAWADGGGPGLNRGLPFDASMRRKPMYFAIKEALVNN